MSKKVEYQLSIAFGVFIFLLTLISSCTHTKLLNLSKKEISELDTIYNQEFNHKFFDTEWIFYEKQICQMKTKFISTKIYSGTWLEINDTIFVNFFYGKRIASERKLFIDKENGKLIELFNEQ